MANDVKPAKIKGTIYWANLTEVNQLSGKYQVDIGQLSDAAVKALEAMGIEVKHKDEQGFFITCKSSYEIFYVDPDGDRMSERVGNGSECTALITPYEWKFKNKKGTSATLKKLIINKLVVYTPEGAVEDDADEAAL